MRDIVDWLGEDAFRGRRVIDIGCGSGIHSFCFHQGGAASLFSFDYDRYSVEATQKFWQRAGRPANWNSAVGSILDKSFVASLGAFDIVYSWGVLHHTGSMWEAIDNACSLVAPGGKLWISLYAKTPQYPDDLALKQRYNRASWFGKKAMEWKWILRLMRDRACQGKNPLGWNESCGRGMNVYNDLVDWLGGLPYEVAAPEETREFCQARGFALLRETVGKGACDNYLFHRVA